MVELKKACCWLVIGVEFAIGASFKFLGVARSVGKFLAKIALVFFSKNASL